MAAPMTGRERVLAALRRRPVDRTPVCNPTSIATLELMDLVDAPFPAANRRPELMARLAATGYTELGFDSIMPVFSMAIAGDRISLVGNINNPVTLYSKGPEQVRCEVWKDLGAGVQLIAPECAVPLDTPTDNLREIPRAVEAWHMDHAASGH